MSVRAARRPLIIALTGGVAAGKSTMAEALAGLIAAMPGGPSVGRAGTDGFLHPNAVLSKRGLLDRKGFPETYDRDALHAALDEVRRGPTVIPGYSHVTYDVDRVDARIIDRPDVLIVEGLGLDRSAPVDVLVYLDADEADQEAWYVSRFLEFWDIGRRDGASFYARFRDLDAAAVARLATRVWSTVNRANLRDHIVPIRAGADIVVTKGADHAIIAIDVRAGDAREIA